MIHVENLSKRYLIKQADPSQAAAYQTLRDAIACQGQRLVSGLRSLGSGRRATDHPRHRQSELWALKDVSFEVKQGERVGIIGKNGAGKSTLLKIISRITEPSQGRLRIGGRVASLLEVGTGFHPELTGRENIFLNGAVLGMSRAEIRAKFDQIVAFAEVDRFLETPVKRYSSGMQVRLAFAVAAHLDPEILVIDEVLAVGDIQFQKKCIRKMEDVAYSGRTILLVSHNMSSILSFSSRCLLLSQGALVADGESTQVVRQFQQQYADQALAQTDLTRCERYGNGKARFQSVQVRPIGADGRPLAVAQTGCDTEVQIAIRAYEPIRNAVVALTVYDEMGIRIIDANSLIKGKEIEFNPDECQQVTIRLRNLRLKPDVYTIGLWIGIVNVADIDGIRYATSFRIDPRKEDIMFSAPYPGFYACEFDIEWDRGCSLKSLPSV